MSEVLSIVINNNIIRMAHLKRVRGGIRIRRLIERECPEGMVDGNIIKKPDAFAGFIRLQMNNANVRVRDVVFTIPADKVMTREVTLPEMSDARIRQIINTNAGEYFPIKLEDYVISFYRVASVRKRTDDTSAADTPEESADNLADLAEDEDIEITDLHDADTSGSSHPGGKRRRVKKKKSPRNAKKSLVQAGEGGAEKSFKRKRGEIRVMAVAAPNDMISAIYETARYLRIHVESIDFIGNSVYQLARLQVGDAPTLTVDISGDHTALTFFDSGDMIMQRNIDFGMDQIVDIVAREKWVSPERADEILRTTKLISEELQQNTPVGEPLYFAIDMIRRTMMYYTRNRGMRPIEKVLMMGDAIYYKGIRDLLEAQLSVPVSSVEQLKGVGIPRTAMMHDQAMRYLDNYGAIIKPVGFLSQELSEEKKKNDSNRVYRMIILGAAAAGLVMVAVPAVRYFRVKKDVDELKKKVIAISDADSVLNSYERAKLRNDDVRNVEGTTASNNDDLSGFIGKLEQVRPERLRIANISVDEGNITMTVYAAGKDVVAALIRNLDEVENISDVEASAITSYYTGSSETAMCTVSCVLTNREKKSFEETKTEEAGNN